MEKTGSHPHPPALNAAKGTMVRDMPADEKKPPSMMRTAREWLQNPWAKAAETRSLIERQVRAVTNGELLGARNAEVAVDRVKKSLEMLKGGTRLKGGARHNGLDAVLLPPPAKNGATPARTGPPKGARMLSDFFNTAALSFRDAASQRPVPQFRFRGSPPDARWAEGALNTDLLRATLREQLSNRSAYTAEDLAGLLHVTDLLLMSDHTLTPGALEFCEEIRNALADEVAQCGALQAGEGRLTDLLNAAKHATSAYVLAKDVIAYAQARQADIGDAFANALAPGEAALLKTIEARAHDFAELPETTRGELRVACRDLFGAEPAKQLFARIDEQRLRRVTDGLKAAMARVNAHPGNASFAPDVSVLTQRMENMKSDLPSDAVRKATQEVIASATDSDRVRRACDDLVVALLGNDAGQRDAALRQLEPTFALLAKLPQADGAGILMRCLAEPLSVLTSGELKQLTALSKTLVPPADAGQPHAARWLHGALGRILPKYESLDRLTLAIDEAQALLGTDGAADPRGQTAELVDRLARIAREKAVLTDPQASQRLRSAVQDRLDALKSRLLQPPLVLTAHFDRLVTADEFAGLHRPLKDLGCLAGHLKTAVEERLRSRLDAQEVAWTDRLRDAQEALDAVQQPGDLAQAQKRALVALDGAMVHERATGSIKKMLGERFDSGQVRVVLLNELRGAARGADVGLPGRQGARDLLALVATLNKPDPSAGMENSPLLARLDALNSYLTVMAGPQGQSPDAAASANADAAKAVFKEALGISIHRGTPIDLNGVRTTVEHSLGEMLQAAQREMPAALAAPVISNQSEADFVRSTIKVRTHGTDLVLNHAAIGARRFEASAAAGNPPPADAMRVATALHAQLGSDGRRLWFDSRFITQELVATVVADYLARSPDSPLRHQFGAGTSVRYSNTPLDFTVIPGDVADTIKLSFVKSDCQLVLGPPTEKNDSGFRDLDWKTSRIAYELTLQVRHDGSAVTLEDFNFDFDLTERPPTVDSAMQTFLDAVEPEPGSPTSLLDAADRKELRGRALERLATALVDGGATPETLRKRAKAAFVQDIALLEPRRKLEFFQKAQEVLRADGLTASSALGQGLQDAIDQMFTLAAAYEGELLSLAAASPPPHTLNLAGGIQAHTGVSRDFWVDFLRSPYEVITPVTGQSIRSEALGDGHDAQALANLRRLGDAMGGVDGRDRLGQVARFAMQGIWAGLDKTSTAASSPFRLEGVPGQLMGGAQDKNYVIRPQRDGSTLVTCHIKWRHDENQAPLHFMGRLADAPTNLTPDSYATGTLEVRILPDGSAQCTRLPRIATYFKVAPQAG